MKQKKPNSHPPGKPTPLVPNFDLRPHILQMGAGWIAFDKPAGLSVHNAESRHEPDLISLVGQLLQADPALSQELKVKPHAPVHPVHRLDADTSGVCLLAFDPVTARTLAEAWGLESTHKSYVAVAKGVIQESEEWAWPLTSRSEGRRDPQGRGERKSAVTQMLRLAVNSYFSLIQLEIKTGRQHQIRRHAALARHPLIGDTRYGDPKYQDKIVALYGFDRLALHSHRLQLRTSSHDLDMTAPVPNCFAKLIEHDIIKG